MKTQKKYTGNWSANSGSIYGYGYTANNKKILARDMREIAQGLYIQLYIIFTNQQTAINFILLIMNIISDKGVLNKTSMENLLYMYDNSKKR